MSKKDNDILLSLFLLNEPDRSKYIRKIYTISNNPERHYKKIVIKKRNGSNRTLYSPNPTLKHIQRMILEKLNYIEVSPYATAYIKGKSLKDNANPHIEKDVILKLDIKNFFHSISFMDVYNHCFKDIYPKPVAMVLTYLCTYYEFLPEGAPTSAIISNIVMRDFDEKIGKYCEENHISYTRYSDDMTFSGNLNPREIIKLVRKLLIKKGMELNDQKTHIIYKSSRQNVTGIIVNKKVNTPLDYRKKVRLEMYYIKKYGLKSHMDKIDNNLSKSEYLNNLLGRVNYIIQINPKKEFIEYRKYLMTLRDR